MKENVNNHCYVCNIYVSHSLWNIKSLYKTPCQALIKWTQQINRPINHNLSVSDNPTVIIGLSLADLK